MILFLVSMLHATLFTPSGFTEVVDGYTNKQSAFPGDSLVLYVNARSATTNYVLKLYDLSGKEVMRLTSDIFPQSQHGSKAYEDGFRYHLTKKFKVPDVPSGIYLWENQIPIIIKSRHAKITVVYPSNTNNAYCNSGGKSLYGFNSTENKGAQKVSFLRPMSLPRHSEAFFRWIQKQDFTDVGYVSDLDLDDYQSIKRSGLLIIAGHSEYWTLQARKNFDRFVSEGKNAMILSGNTMWWQVRYNKTQDQLICYRNDKDDPVKVAKLKTINWFEPSLAYPIYSTTGTDFQNAGYGLKLDNGWDGYKIVGNSPLLTGTSLRENDILPLPSDETDGAPLLSMQNGLPVIDRQKLPFEKIELIGYDHVAWRGKAGVATWIIFKATSTSGIVINTASTDWCSTRGIGASEDIRTITRNMITKLKNGETVFADDASVRIVN